MICRYAQELGLLDRACKIVPIMTAQFPTSALRPAYSVLDKSSLYETLEFQPIHWSVSLLEVLQDLCDAKGLAE
jgi:dTDP-4-dehydrorhamnose reductase